MTDRIDPIRKKLDAELAQQSPHLPTCEKLQRIMTARALEKAACSFERLCDAYRQQMAAKSADGKKAADA